MEIQVVHRENRDWWVGRRFSGMYMEGQRHSTTDEPSGHDETALPRGICPLLFLPYGIHEFNLSKM